LLGRIGIHGGCSGKYVLDGTGALLELAGDAGERVDQGARIRLRAARTTGRSPKAIGSSSPPKATSSTADRIACFEPNSRYTVAIGVLLSSAIASIVVAG
jgi:hypothetical protein